MQQCLNLKIKQKSGQGRLRKVPLGSLKVIKRLLSQLLILPN